MTVRRPLQGLAVHQRVHEADEEAVVLHHLVAHFEEFVAATGMDGGERTVVINDVKQLTFVLCVFRRKREQVAVERMQVLVLAAQVVEFIHGGRGEVNSKHFVATQSPGFGVITEPRAGHQNGAFGRAGGVLEKFKQGRGRLLEIPVVLAFGIEVVPEFREVLR